MGTTFVQLHSISQSKFAFHAERASGTAHNSTVAQHSAVMIQQATTSSRRARSHQMVKGYCFDCDVCENTGSPDGGDGF